MYQPLKLTRKTAEKLIGKVSTGLKITGGDVGTDMYRYEAICGLLMIRCENDWYDHNGRYRLSLFIASDGTPVTLFFYPDTLQRDYDTEQAERKKLRKEDRRIWAQLVGPDIAHREIDRLCAEE